MAQAPTMRAGRTPSLRPFAPGEYITNPDGSYSTERTVTVQDRNGQWVNVPSLWKGPDGSTIDMGDDEDRIGEALGQYEAGGAQFSRFPTVDDAVRAAEARSSHGGAFEGSGMATPDTSGADGTAMANPWDNDPIVTPAGASSEAPWDNDPIIEAAPVQTERDIAGTADAYGRGIAKATTFGFADEIGAGARWLGGKVLPWQPEVTYDEALAEVRGSDKAVADAHPVADVAGQLTGAVGTANALAARGLSPTARAIESGAGLRKVAVASSAEGALMGAAQGLGNAEGNLSDRALEAGYGAVGGGALGLGLPLATSALGAAARKAISPFSSSPERARQVQTLAREGVETSAGQRTGSNSLRYAESEIGGQTAQDLFERQGEQFTSAALKRAGVDAKRATPDVIDDAFTTIGKKFDDLAARNEIKPDERLARDLGRTASEYMMLTPESQRAPIVMNIVNDIAEVAKRGNIDGRAYQAARSRLDRAARSSARDPQLQQALYGLRNSLDDAMSRSTAFSNPKDSALWREARNEYRNLLVLEKASTAAGENAAQGLISPSALRNATVSTHGRRNYARGKGDFAELARAGEAVMKPMPNSGTAGRLSAQNMGAGIGSLIGMGAAGYGSGGDPMTMLAGAATGYAVPRIAGRAMMTGPIQSLLSNQAAQGLRMGPNNAPLATLLNIEGSEVAPSFGRSLSGLLGM